MASCVLLIDDLTEDRIFTRLLIRRLNPDSIVHEFSYAEEALLFLKSPKRPDVDLIIVDLNMPRMNGLEFADRFQNLYPELKGSARLCMISGTIDPDAQASAKAHPAIMQLLSKPLDKEAIKPLMA